MTWRVFGRVRSSSPPSFLLPFNLQLRESSQLSDAACLFTKNVPPTTRRSLARTVPVRVGPARIGGSTCTTAPLLPACAVVFAR